jgi:hypothetical protein
MILSGAAGWAPSNLSYKTPAFMVAFMLMYYIKRRYLAWWEKYNYLTAASLTGGSEYIYLVKISGHFAYGFFSYF